MERFFLSLVATLSTALLAKSSPYVDSLSGTPTQGYTITLSVGTPPQKVRVILDTGSGDLVLRTPKIGTNHFQPNKSSTYVSTRKPAIIAYMSGSAVGHVGSDVISTKSLDFVANASFLVTEDPLPGVVSESATGILGLAYSGLAKPIGVVTPLFDVLVSSGGLQNQFSIRLCGVNATSNLVGSIILGGSNSSFYVGPIYYTPIKRELHYEVIITRIRVGGVDLNIPCSQYNSKNTIVDTGTDKLLFPENVYNSLVSLIKANSNVLAPEAFWRLGTQLRCDPNFDFSAFPDISISLLSSQGLDKELNLVIGPKTYLRFQSKNNKDGTCYSFGVGVSNTGSILGLAALDGFYVAFDRANKRIGFAKATCEGEKASQLSSRVDAPVSRVPHNCAYQNLRGEPGTGYTLNVSIGTPKQWFKILLDTGSSNFAVAAAPVEQVTSYFHIEDSSTYENLRKSVGVDYTGGSWRGTLATDVITSPDALSSNVSSPIRVRLATIAKSEKLFKDLPMQGLLGLAYKSLAKLNNDRTIVDSGTTTLRLPTLVHGKVVDLIKTKTTLINSSSSFWQGGRTLYCWNPDRPEFDRFPTVTLDFLSSEGDNGDKYFRLTVLPQMYLQAYRSVEDDERDCYKFSILPSTSGTVLGAVVMEGYYVVFDRENERVGFATSTCEIRDSSFEKPTVAGPFTRQDAKDCRYDSHSVTSASLVVIYVSAAIIGVAIVAIAIVCAMGRIQRRRRRTVSGSAYRELNDSTAISTDSS
ncbi:beta-secretase 1-like isoform X2 [Oscarella lobularis]|uniref:beta-secretase 1-like isoform X2 n=1 Tax=Oscarella lobularis TaxID=121494 RepID=UPI003314156A